MSKSIQFNQSKLNPYISLADQFRRGHDSPRHYLERIIERTRKLEPELQAFTTLSYARARMAADAASKRWRAGQALSAIDGMPIGIKDVIETFDMPTQLGSPAFKDFQTRVDAASIYALREAGAVIYGKTTTTELISTYPAPTTNPHDAQRTPGGSSAGSAAAVGAGILPCALGTQVIGSIIRPASFCGAFGYKPTLGAINRGGSHDFHSHSCLGMVGAGLAEIWATAQAIVRRVGGDPGYEGLRGDLELGKPSRPKKLAIIEAPGWDQASAEAKKAFFSLMDLLRGQGVSIVTAKDDPVLANLEGTLSSILKLASEICDFESRWITNHIISRDSCGVSPDAKARMEAISSFTLDDYRSALQERTRVCAWFDEISGGYDAFCTLSAPAAAPKGLTWTGNPSLAVSASVLGAPALSLPLMVEEGLPLGLQVVAGRHNDFELFNHAQWIVEAAAKQVSE